MAVVGTIKSLIWTVLLLLALMYLFAVLFTQAAHSHLMDQSDDAKLGRLHTHWGSVPRSVYSLFKAITNGISWDQVADPLNEVHGIWFFLFLAYVALSNFAVLNVVTGVFCQMAIEGAGRDQEEIMHEMLNSREKYSAELWSIFTAASSKKSGKVSLRDFQRLMKHERLKKFFTSLEVDIEDAYSLFKLLDKSGDGEIDVDEFVTGCLRLRGQARSVDLALLQYQVRWLTERFSHFTEGVEAAFGRMQKLQTRTVQSPEIVRKLEQSAVVSV